MPLLETAAFLIADKAKDIIGKKLVKLIADEIRLAWGYTTELMLLQKNLKLLSAMLAGVSGKQNTNPLFHDWLKSVVAVVYDAEVMFDAWSYDDLERNRPVKPMLNIKIKPLSETRQARAHKVKSFATSIEGLLKRAWELQIKPIEVAGGETYETSSKSDQDQKQEEKLKEGREFVDYKNLFGRDEDSAKTVKSLQKASKTKATFNVVAIVGMAGVGKTSLSKNVVRRADVKMLFEQVISVTVSHDHTLNVILRRIAEVVINEGMLNTAESSVIISKLQNKLNNKKYLLILDDVWDTFDWSIFKSAFDEIGGLEGTTILVTSRRMDEVGDAKTDGVYDIHRLEKLSPDDSWSLFTDRMPNDVVFSPEKKTLAKGMVNSCDGLPLAINLLRSLLRNNNSLQKWEEFAKSEEWKTSDSGILRPSLELSYKYLKSSTLKTCFSYCAIFGEDEQINKQRLIHLWMAQGFLQAPSFAEMEDVGEECFNELLNSSLFHEPVMDHLSNVISVKMHDLVRDLACDISKEEIWCYDKKAHTSGSGSGSDSGSVTVSGFRHMSVPASGCDVQIQHGKNLSTCVFNGMISKLDFLKDCPNVRALSFHLSPDTRLKEKDWEVLGDLKHLRFLEIQAGEMAAKKYIKVMEPKILPQIAKLYHLQTLRMLVDILYDETLHDSKPDIPKEFGNLVNLRHIILLRDRTMSVFEGLGLLSSLQTLPTINLEKQSPPDGKSVKGDKRRRVSENNEGDGRIIDDLQKLEKVRGTLKILNLQCIKSREEAEALGLGNKSSLTTLHLSGFGYSGKADEIFEALKPHNNLIDLQILNFRGKKLPTWLAESFSLSNLASLHLKGFSSVGKLNLGELISLRILKLIECSKLTLTLPDNDFKCCKLLEKLKIVGCDKIDSIPDLSPLSRLRSVTVLSRRITTLPCSRVSLTKLYTTGFLLPESLSKDDPICKSLKTLILQDYLPEQCKHFAALQKLKLLGIEELETLPEWLGELESMNNLELFDLPNLKCLPSKAAVNGLSNWTRFRILSCPTLHAELNKKGDEWSKISHLPLYYNIS